MWRRLETKATVLSDTNNIWGIKRQGAGLDDITGDHHQKIYTLSQWVPRWSSWTRMEQSCTGVVSRNDLIHRNWLAQRVFKDGWLRWSLFKEEELEGENNRPSWWLLLARILDFINNGSSRRFRQNTGKNVSHKSSVCGVCNPDR